MVQNPHGSQLSTAPKYKAVSMENKTQINHKTSDKSFCMIQLCPNEEYPRSFYTDNSSGKQTRAFGKLPTIALTKETSMDKFLKTLHLVSEVQVGNEYFDNQVFIYSDAMKGFIKSLLSNKKLQEAISTLLNMGWYRVVLFHEDSPVRLVYFGHQPPSSGRGRQCIEALNTIVEQLPNIQINR